MIINKTEDQLRQEIQGICQIGNASAIAKAMGISRTFLYDIMTGRRSVSPKVAEYLGYYVEITPASRIYKKIETNNQIVSVEG